MGKLKQASSYGRIPQDCSMSQEGKFRKAAGEFSMIFFTYEEAESKIGQKIRLLCDLPGVPMGTIGEVIGIFCDYMNNYGILIVWEIEESPIDECTKDKYKELLAIIK